MHEPEPASIETRDDIHDAALRLRASAFELGFTRVLALDDVSARDVMTDARGTPVTMLLKAPGDILEPWWLNHAIWRKSPFALACRYESEPYWADIDGIHGPRRNPFLDAITFRKFKYRAAMKAAIIVPVHLPFGQIGMVLFGSTSRDWVRDKFASLSAPLSLLARHFITGYVSILRHQLLFPMACRLTPREIECLRWAAMGKTDQETAVILQLSHATIRFHINNAAKRLDAVNRSQAILKAAHMGYLSLPY
jgi:DNA-binding CsgD family transcriptional regulator